MNTVLSVRGVGKSFVRQPVLTDIHLDLHQNEILALVGESGSGKTTLSRILCGFEKLDAGEVLFRGNDLSKFSAYERSKLIQLIFQDPHSSLNPRWSLDQSLREPLRIHGVKTSQTDISRAMHEVGLGLEHLEKYPDELSGGQKQRAVIARALLMKPQILVCDEPVSALDVSIQGQILALLKKMQLENQISILFISHDLSVVRALCDRTAVLRLGKIVECESTETLFTSPREEYTKTLLDSVIAFG